MIEILIVSVLAMWAVFVGVYVGLELIDKAVGIWLKRVAEYQKIQHQWTVQND